MKKVPLKVFKTKALTILCLLVNAQITQYDKLRYYHWLACEYALNFEKSNIHDYHLAIDFLRSVNTDR